MTDDQKTFEYSAIFQMMISLNSVNSVIALSSGKTTIKFKDGQIFEITKQFKSLTNGLLIGQPTFNLFDIVQINCNNENLKSRIKFKFKNEYTISKLAKGLMSYFFTTQNYSSSDQLEIQIYKTISDDSQKGKDIIISKGTGSFLSHIQFDKQIVFIIGFKNIKMMWDKPIKQQQITRPMESDVRNRLDKYMLEINEPKKAQVQMMKSAKQEQYDHQLRKLNKK